LQPMVTGYGFACVKDQVRASGQMFELEYWAPELLTRTPYTHKIDVFAFAVLFNELWSRQPPYPAIVVPRVIAAGVAQDSMRPKIDPTTPPVCARIIQAAWAQAPEQRPEMSKLHTILVQPAEQLLSWNRS